MRSRSFAIPHIWNPAFFANLHFFNPTKLQFPRFCDRTSAKTDFYNIDLSDLIFVRSSDFTITHRCFLLIKQSLILQMAESSRRRSSKRDEEDFNAAARSLARTQSISIDTELAAEVFDHFMTQAATLKSILRTFRYLCDVLRLKPQEMPYFYPKLKSKLTSWKANALWAKFDKRASHKVYMKGKACAGQRVLVIGAGPCGLRTAIEAQLLGKIRNPA